MNIENIVLEMLSRIQALEEEVKALRGEVEGGLAVKENVTGPKTYSTAAIRDYIEKKKEAARAEGKKSVVVLARDIHNELKLKSRYPMVCNAMYQMMSLDDVVVNAPASGYSSTVEIEYFIQV